MGTEGFSASNDRPKIVWVSQSINSHQQRGFSEISAAFDQGLEIMGLRCRGLQHDPLMNRATTELR